MSTTTHDLSSFERQRRFHQQLLAHLPTYTGEELARLRELDPAEAGGANRALRESHQIFAVPLGDTWHYPRFQFDTCGRPCALATKLLQALGPIADPWDVLQWFVEPNPDLDGVAPLERWAVDPENVIDVARRANCVAPRAH